LDHSPTIFPRCGGTRRFFSFFAGFSPFGNCCGLPSKVTFCPSFFVTRFVTLPQPSGSFTRLLSRKSGLFSVFFFFSSYYVLQPPPGNPSTVFRLLCCPFPCFPPQNPVKWVSLWYLSPFPLQLHFSKVSPSVNKGFSVDPFCVSGFFSPPNFRRPVFGVTLHFFYCLRLNLLLPTCFVVFLPHDHSLRFVALTPSGPPPSVATTTTSETSRFFFLPCSIVVKATLVFNKGEPLSFFLFSSLPSDFRSFSFSTGYISYPAQGFCEFPLFRLPETISPPSPSPLPCSFSLWLWFLLYLPFNLFLLSLSTQA